MKTKPPTIISLINLWCTKNLVDSQFLLGKLLTSSNENLLYTTDPYAPEVELVFLNTCGFISSGREEALQTINKLLNKGKKVCITWCAVKYREELANDPTRTTLKSQVSLYPRNELNQIFLSDIPRALTNLDQGFEYLKIAEGCNNSCAFCIIPKIRGKQISLPLPKILQEVQNLVHQGVHEIILLAQDSTRYGTDLYGKPQLFELLEQMEQLPWDFRYRILYLYPDLLTLHQLKKLTSFRKFIPYFDIPLQHSASTVLQRMGRFYDEQAIHDFLQCIQTEFPVHFIRTNFIIGFPGETEEEFQHLQSFIQKDYFDNIALFEYHDEPLAKSSQFPNQIPEKLIRSRFRLLRSLINQLFLARSASRKGKEERGYVQSITTHRGVNLLTVRPRLHSPEMDEVDDVVRDHIISVEGETLQVGSKVKYRV